MRVITLFFSSLVLGLAGCHSIHKPSNHTQNNANCARIIQALSGGAAQNTNHHTNSLSAAQRAHLLKLFNYYGCNANSDNRYAYPDQSLEINTKLNNATVRSLKK